MITIYNQQMQRVAILENTYKIGYTKEVNNLWTCSFSLPANDPKAEEVTAKRFLELYDHDKRIGMFQINPIKTVRNDNDNSITYNCEHVLATLHGNVLFRYHQFANYSTRYVLEALLDMQEVNHWVLGRCSFSKYFHYGWENEKSLLNAVFSVPKPFDQKYQWTWDDSVYPWVLNLDNVTDEIIDEIRYGKNLKGITRNEDPFGIVTRLYCLGYGEGINQLGIEKVNPTGLPYIQAEQEYIDKYGIQSDIWIDKKIEDANTLFASGKVLLDVNKIPKVSYSVDCIDYEHIDPYKITKYTEGKVVKVKDADLSIDVLERIMKITKNDIYGNPLDIQFEIGNVVDDISMTFSDLQKKQLVNDAYSQGSTNIDSHNYNDNCDSTHPAIIKFYLPDDLVNINTMTLSYETEKFRAYEKATKGGGATISSGTTSAGGANVQASTTSSGGSSVQSSTTSAGGGSLETTSATGAHRHRMFGFQTDTGSAEPPGNFMNYIAVADSNGTSAAGIFAPGFETDLYTHEASGEHSHTVNMQAHSHSVSINIPSHNHDFSINIPDHEHEFDFELPDHTHDLEYGIYESSETASTVTIKVDGNTVPLTSTSANDFNIIPYLSKDSEGKVNRGQWHEVEIYPNNLARINANIISRLFIQSRTGGTY